jgi:hypothetical protein
MFFLPLKIGTDPVCQLISREEFPHIVSDLISPRLLDDNEERIDEVFDRNDLLGKRAVHEACIGLCHGGFESLVWLTGCC